MRCVQCENLDTGTSFYQRCKSFYWNPPCAALVVLLTSARLHSTCLILQSCPAVFLKNKDEARVASRRPSSVHDYCSGFRAYGPGRVAGQNTPVAARISRFPARVSLPQEHRQPRWAADRQAPIRSRDRGCLSTGAEAVFPGATPSGPNPETSPTC